MRPIVAALLALTGGFFLRAGLHTTSPPSPPATATATQATWPPGPPGTAMAAPQATAPPGPAGTAATTQATSPPGPPDTAATTQATPSGPRAGLHAGSSPPGAVAATPTPPPPVGRSVPVRLRISRIAVDTALMRLGLRHDGTVQVPPLTAGAPAGWYEHLVSPGEVGPAVILGHVDSARSGPAVFYRLGELRPGDQVSVDRADGSTAVFQVTAVAAYPKSGFPGAAVYGPADHAALRLVTCGGRFDRRRGGYLDNVVAYATLSIVERSSIVES